MGRLRSTLNRRVPAATLLESVLALALLAGALSFGVYLHFRIQATDHLADKLQAWSLSEQLLRTGIAPPASTEATVSSGALQATLRREPLTAACDRITITCTKGERQVLERHLIRVRP